MAREGSPVERGPQWDPKASLRQIMMRPLLPENVDTYFDDALDSVLELAKKVSEKYVETHLGNAGLQGKDIEDKAFAENGLDSIHEILGIISEKQELLLNIKTFIVEHTEVLPRILIPPQHWSVARQSGDGSYEAPEKGRRIKMVLYTLTSEGVELSEIDLQKGLVGNIMRKDSYVAINVPSLHRIIFECDTEENLGFIFDTEELCTLGYNISAVSVMTKEELAVTLGKHPTLGASLTHRGDWLQKLRSYLVEDFTADSMNIELTEEILPVASNEELDPWRGFYTTEENKHYGSRSALLRKLRIEGVSVPGQSKDILAPFTHNLHGRLLKTPQGVVYRAFVYEDMYRNIVDTQSLAKEGEWKDFFLQDGNHWGSTKVLSAKFKVNIKLVHNIVQREHPVFIKHYAPILEGSRRKGTSSRLYAYEDFEPLLGIFEKIPSVMSEGEWVGFNERHFGHPSAIARKLGDASVSNVRRFILKHSELATIELRNLSGRVDTAYSFEDVKRLWNQRNTDHRRKPRTPRGL